MRFGPRGPEKGRTNAAFENSRINDFALWKAIETKVVELLPRELQPRRDGVTEATAAPEKRMEASP